MNGGVLTDSGLQRLFASALSSMKSALRAERYLILFDEHASGTMAVQESAGLDVTEFWKRAPVSLTLLEKLRRSATPWLTDDLQGEPDLAGSSSALIAGIRSVISAPLLDEKQRVRGLLYADHCGEAEAFSRQELARLTTLALELERVLWPAAPPTTPRPLPPPPPRRAVPVALPTAAPTHKSTLTGRNQTILLRSLSVMVAAGIPLPRALHVLEGQPDLSAVCRAARVSLERGTELSVALQGASPSFTTFQLKLIKVGERTGSLVDILRQLAEYEERRQALALRLRSALTYPAFLLTACLVMLVLGPPYLLKGQLKMIEMAGGELPLLTRVLYAASDLRVLAALGLLAAVASSLMAAFVRTPKGALWLDRMLLRTRLWRLVVATRFAQALALQLKVGLSVLEAVPQSAAASGSPVLLERSAASVAALREGSDLTGALAAAETFPHTFIATVEAGEESGKVSDSLQWVARLFQEELEAALEMAVAALEPTIMLIMGLATAVVALATMLPMVKVVQSL